ncbi:MAG: DUF819 family protein [Bacteroidales bacterium]|nr:DUF819 family protein [Bacteroidales bacterium]
MIGNILVILFFLLSPACVLWLCRRFPLLDKIGPVLILYIVGIIFGNLFHPSGMAGIQEVLSSATVPLAIPLMLFSCTFQRSKTRSQLIALLLGLAAVTLSVLAGYFLFGRNMDDGAKIGGMLTGVYTGGTINLASLKVMLDVPEETFILLNSFDMAISFLYLTFLLSVGIRLFRRWLPVEPGTDDQEVNGQEKEQPFKGLFTKQGLRDAGVLLAVDALIIGISAGLGLLAGDGAFMTVLILSLTTLGIAASFWKPLKKRKHGYDIGMYCIYVFSVVVASMADLRSLSISGSLNMLGYLTFVIFFSLLLEVLAAKPLKVDADTMTVSSVAYICSPPFVPMMAAAMKNKSVLAGGLSVGVVGYAVGNYLGFLIARLLEML